MILLECLIVDGDGNVVYAVEWIPVAISEPSCYLMPDLMVSLQTKVKIMAHCN